MSVLPHILLHFLPTLRLETIFLPTCQGPLYSLHAEHILAAYYIASDTELSGFIRYLMDQNFVQSTASMAWYVPWPLEPRLGCPEFLFLLPDSTSHTSDGVSLPSTWQHFPHIWRLLSQSVVASGWRLFIWHGSQGLQQTNTKASPFRGKHGRGIAWLYCPQ